MGKNRKQKTPSLLGLTTQEGNIQLRLDDVIIVALNAARGQAEGLDIGHDRALERIREALQGAS